MKVEKCILQMPEGTDNSNGSAVIPSGIFEFLKEMNVPYKFLAVKKKKEKLLKLVPIELDKRIYEVYCEVLDNQRIGNMVEFISKFAYKHNNLTLLSEVEGICMGQGSKFPCTFDGFVVLKGDDESVIDALKKGLEDLSDESERILSKISIEIVE